MQERRKKILIVDDDPGTTTTFKIGLESKGFEVDVFNDPDEVIKNFKSNYYSLSLIDIRMPSMNGFELYQELSKLDNSLHVCFITSFKSYYQSLIEEYPGMDQKCYIQKPVSIDDLVNHIKSVII